MRERDPARIDRIVELLRARWKEQPDIRLGQLVVNVSGGRELSTVFYLEDDVFEAKLSQTRADGSGAS